MMNFRGLVVLLATTVAISGADFSRTVIFMYYESLPGEDVFLRGGISTDRRSNCTDDVTTDGCAIAIRTRLLGTIDHYDSYNYWRVGDNYLDWHGAEPTQGSNNGNPAQGTPTAWTTSNAFSPAYQELNTFGDNYWMVEMDMDCAQTEEGWFEVKTFISDWEDDIAQNSTCDGTVGGTPPYASTNHMGLCGNVNVFFNGASPCTINSF